MDWLTAGPCPTRRDGQSFEEHQREVAAWLGYADVAAMNRHHDRLHRSLMHWLSTTSYALREAAGEPLIPYEQHAAALEEDAVLHVQRLCVHLGITPPTR